MSWLLFLMWGSAFAAQAPACDDLLSLSLTHHQTVSPTLRRLQNKYRRVAESTGDPPTAHEPRELISTEEEFERLARRFGARTERDDTSTWFEVSNPTAGGTQARVTRESRVHPRALSALMTKSSALTANQAIADAALTLHHQNRDFRVRLERTSPTSEAHLRIELLGRGHAADERIGGMLRKLNLGLSYDPRLLRRLRAGALFHPGARVDVPHAFIAKPDPRDCLVLHELRHAFHLKKCLAGDPSVQIGSVTALSNAQRLPGHGGDGPYVRAQGNDEADVYLFHLKNLLNRKLNPGGAEPVQLSQVIRIALAGLEVAARNLLVARRSLVFIESLNLDNEHGRDFDLNQANARGRLEVSRWRQNLDVILTLNHPGAQFTWEFPINTLDQTPQVDLVSTLRAEVRRRERLNIQRVYQFQLALKALDRAVHATTERQNDALLLALNRSLIYQRTTYRRPDLAIEGPRELVLRLNSELAHQLGRTPLTHATP